MAKSKSRGGSRYELDDLSFEGDLDIPDFNFDGPGVKNDRKPAMKFARGFAGGVKDTATSPAFIAKTMKKALPKGYGQGIDLLDETTGSLRSLYDSATKEVKPALNDMKRFTARVLPKGERYLPKSVATRLKKWSKSDDETAALSAEAAREQGMQLEMMNLFGDQIQQQGEIAAKREAQDKIKDGLDHARHRDQLGQLDAIRRSTQQQTAYMTNVMSKVQRKSLELQFRQYFAQKDTLLEMRRFNAIAEQQMQEIKKNTGLPDYVKLQGHEAFSQIMRNKFIGAMADGVFERRRNFIKNLTGNVGKAIMSKVSGAANGMREALSMANMGVDMVDSMSGMVDPAEMGGNLAGSGATHLAGGFLAKKLAPWLAKQRGVMKWGNNIAYGAENLPQLLGGWARSSKGFGAAGGMFDGLVGFAKDLINQTVGGTDQKVQTDNTANLNTPGVFTRQAHKSITEVIPGFLARIHRELKILRTGDETAELTVYDFDKNKFSSDTERKNNAFKSLFGWGREGTRSQVDAMLDKIDPEKKLTPEQRSELGKKMLNDNMRNGLFSKERMTDQLNGAFSGSQHSAVYADLFEKALANDASGQKRNDLSAQYRNLGSYIGDSRKKIQDHINAGMGDYLYEAGVIKPDGTIDQDKLNAYHFDEDFHANAPARRLGKGKGRVPGFAKGGMHEGGAALTGEEGPELKVHGPARFYNHQQTMQMLKEAGVGGGVKETLGFMADTMLRIEDQLQHGLVTFDGSEMLSSMGNKARGFFDRLRRRGQQARGKMGDRAQHYADLARERGKDFAEQARERGKYYREEFQTRAKGWDRNLRELGQDFGADLKRMGKGLWRGAKKLGQSAQKQLGWAGGQAKSLGQGLHEKWFGRGDIYVNGEAEPRLSALKLRNGLYRDKLTGKVIRSFKDLNGTVLDEYDHEVLSAEEVGNAYILDGYKKITLEKLAGLKERLQAGAKKMFDLVSGHMPSAIKFIKDTGKKIWNFLVNHPQDVYVKGKMDKAALRASVMAAGGYFSKLTSKPIKHPGEIDGTILDSDGNEALTADDIKLGLVDRFGLPLRTRMSRLLGGGMALAGKAVQKVLGAGRWALGKLGNVGRALGRGIGNLTGDWNFSWGGGDTTDLLTQIRDILDQRLPGGGLLGGAGGNGLDIDLGDLERQGKPGATGGPGGQKPQGRWGRWSDKLKGKGRLGRLGGAAMDGIGRAGGAVKNAAGGVLSKFGGKALGLGMKGLGVAGAAYGAYSAYDNIQQGNYGEAALDAGMAGVGLAASGASLAGMGSALATGAAAVGTGIAALASSPVILGAAAVAAVGALGYLGYKLATRKQLGKLSKLRYAQYGFAESDTDHLQTVFGLEDKLRKAVKWEDSGPRLDLDKVEGKEVLDLFGVNAKDQGSLGRFSQWFQYRFKPVFLTHLAALKAAADGKWLDDVDSFKDAQAKRYFNLSRFENGPYDQLTSPFGDGRLLDSNGVSAVAASLSNDLAKEKDDKKKDQTPAAAATTVMGGPAAVAAASAAAAAVDVSAKATGNNPTAAAQNIRLADTGTPVSAVAGFTGFALTGSGKLDALTAVRYKTYGLHEMVVEKSRALAMLEMEMLRRLRFDGKAVARFEGNLDAILTTCGPAFGVTGTANDAAYDWKSWFNQRFLPTFLNFATAMAQATGKTDFVPNDMRDLPASLFQQLKGNQAVDVAQAIYTTSGVWSVTASPWPGFVLNTEVRSIEQNFEALKELSKKTVQSEQVGSKDSKGTGKDNGQGLTDGTNGAGKSVMARAWESFSDKASSLLGKARDAAGSIGTGIYDATHTDPNTSLNGGRVSTLSEGGEGKYDSLPMPKGDGKWEYFKDLFAATAKIAGVDPKLMASITAIESGFNSTIKNPLGSATGLFQFTSDTWRTMMQRYGAKFGIPPGTSATDPRANALLGAMFIRDNFQALKSVKASISDTDIYMAHFLGAAGAKKFFKADPGAAIGQVLPKIVSQNPDIVWKDRARTQMRTVSEVYSFMNSKVRARGKQFGLDGAGSGSLESPATAPSAPAAEAAASAPAIPVSEQVAAPQASSTPASTPAASTPSTPSEDPASVGLSQSAAPISRSQDVAAVQQAQREDLNKSLGTLGDTATQHLRVSIDALDVLRAIERRLGLLQPAVASEANDPAQAMQSRTARAMPTPPVSMSKLSTSF